MSFFDSIMVSLFSMTLVFSVLVTLSVFLIVFSKVLGLVRGRENDGTAKVSEDAEITRTESIGDSVPVSAGTLKLIGTDEKTAAMIMAIVSNETNIPLSELSFKSIKCIEES